MIVLDTNIVSEMMKNTPSSAVIKWIDEQETTQLFVTTITIAEIEYGIRALSESRRRHSLENAFNAVLREAFAQRILSFDETAAYNYGKIMSHRKEIGRPMSILDGQIAAIAFTHEKTIATRNIRDFSDCRLKLVNPFE
jgi:predicted nucleic acid-binding protein